MSANNPTPKNEDKDPSVETVAKTFFDLINGNGVTNEAIKQYFTDIKSGLQPARFNEAVDAIETVLSQEVKSMPSNVKSYLKMAVGMIEEAKSNNNGIHAIALQALSESQPISPLCEAFNQIAQAKGDNAGPVVKVFAEEAAKLTDAQYNDMLEQIKLVVRVSDRVSTPPPAAPANPFRKGPAA